MADVLSLFFFLLGLPLGVILAGAGVRLSSPRPGEQKGRLEALCRHYAWAGLITFVTFLFFLALAYLLL